MNYTKNYHLPQWVKSDRIMMEDFNAMCANIESGLVQGRDSLQGERRELDRELLRMAYNHYQLVKDMDPFPYQHGVFCQSASKVSIPNVDRADGAWYLARADSRMDERAFFETFQMVSVLNITKNRPSAMVQGVCRFNSPMPGVLGNMRMYLSLDNVEAGTTLVFRAYLKNMDTGIVECETTFDELLEHSNAARYLIKKLGLAFHANVNYQLIMETSQAPGTGTLTLLLDDSSTRATLYGTKYSGAVSFTFDGVAESGDGLAFIRYRTAGTGGTITLNWNGKAVKPVLVNGTAGSVQEAVYRLPERPMKGNQISASFLCSDGGEMWIYEWGAVLC